MDTIVALGAIAAIGISYVLLPVGLSVIADYEKAQRGSLTLTMASLLKSK